MTDSGKPPTREPPIGGTGRDTPGRDTPGRDTSGRPLVLVTRPLLDAVSLGVELSALGYIPLLAPLLNIQPPEPGTAAALETALADAQALLLTSANGARAVAGLTTRRSLPVLAVGPATAEAARTAGFDDVTTAGGDVVALAELVGEVLTPADGPLVHAAGRESAGDLPGALGTRGFTLRRVVVYRAEAVAAMPEAARRALIAGEVAVAPFFSPRTARNFVTLCQDAALAGHCRSVTALALSPAVAEALATLPWREIRTAERPELGALLALLPPPESVGEAARIAGPHVTPPAQTPRSDMTDTADGTRDRKGDAPPAADDAAAPKGPQIESGPVPADGANPAGGSPAADSDPGGALPGGSLPGGAGTAAAPASTGTTETAGSLTTESGPDRPGLERPGLERPGLERPGLENPDSDAVAPEGNPVTPPPPPPPESSADAPLPPKGGGPPDRTGRGPALAVGAALLVLLAVAAAGLWLRVGETEQRLADRLSALEQASGQTPAPAVGLDDLPEDLAGRLAALEAAIAAEDADTAVTQRLAALEQAMAEGPATDSALEAAVAAAREAQTALSTEAAQLSERLAAAEAALDRAPEAAALQALRDDLIALQERLDTALDGTRDALAALSDEVQRRFAQIDARLRAGTGTAASAFTLALGQLQDSVASGAPFATPLAAVERLARDRGVAETAEMAGPLAVLEGRATLGVATLPQLRERFPAVAAALARTDYVPPESEDWLDTVLARAAEIVSIRRTTVDPAAETAEGRAALAEARLAAGDLAGAVAALEALPEPALGVAADWLAEARARLAADTALDALRAQALAALSEAEEAAADAAADLGDPGAPRVAPDAPANATPPDTEAPPAAESGTADESPAPPDASASDEERPQP